MWSCRGGANGISPTYPESESESHHTAGMAHAAENGGLWLDR